MSKLAKSFLIGTLSGYVVAYSFGSIWYYNIEKRVLKPVSIELEKETPNYAKLPLIYLGGWKSLFDHFYATTDYEKEIEKVEKERNETKED